MNLFLANIGWTALLLGVFMYINAIILVLSRLSIGCTISRLIVYLNLLVSHKVDVSVPGRDREVHMPN